MKKLLLVVFLLLALTPGAYADSILATAGNFAVLAGSTVTNTGPTTITGNIGLYPGSSYTGPGSVTQTGVAHINDAIAQQAQADLTTAYLSLASLLPTSNLTGQDLGGMTLASGVYSYSSSAQLTGTLTLDAQNDANAFWVFQVGSALTTASGSVVNIINGNGNNSLYWQVGSSATLGTSTSFEGNIVALTSITLNTTASINCGRALARNGAVTMDTNTISTGCAGVAGETDSNGLAGGLAYIPGTPAVPGVPGALLISSGDGRSLTTVPEPPSFVLLGTVLIGIGFFSRLRKG